MRRVEEGQLGRVEVVRMHVAFGRVRRKSRIFADSTDFRGFWVYWRFSTGRCGLEKVAVFGHKLTVSATKR